MDEQLRLQLSEEGADAERLTVLTGYLRAELLQLDVEDVSAPPAAEPPPGARVSGVATVGALLIALGQSAEGLRSVVSVIRDWLRRGGGTGRAVRLELGGDALELSPASAADQERLIELFVRAGKANSGIQLDTDPAMEQDTVPAMQGEDGPAMRGEADPPMQQDIELPPDPLPAVERAIREPAIPGRGVISDVGSAVSSRVGKRSRYLKGQFPESVPVSEPFSLLVSVIQEVGQGSAKLKPFDVPPTGCDVLVVVHAPGLRFLGQQRTTVHVPAVGDSEPVMFELRPDTPGPRSVSVTAWLGGTYLGELFVEISVERERPPGTNRDVLAEISTESTSGAVSLVVRYDPRQNAYRFEFRDEDNPEEVTSNLAYEPGPRVERLVAELDELAKDRTGYSTAQTRDYLINAGAGLWRELIPERLRQQFWDRQHRIRQLTILADKDAVPWELLYPMDPGHDAGFLVEQFPVTRAVFGRAPTRRLRLKPARFVLPGGSPPEAYDEIEAVRQLLDSGQPPGAVIAALTPLQELISSGDFGLLHFACHNRFDPADGSSIEFEQARKFTPTLMTTAAINHVLANSAPTIFINSCRSAGLTATYNRLDGWASKFLEAGAAAFIGSLWAVSDTTGHEFATELYSHLQRNLSLGKALLAARRAAAGKPGDPTWLAYAVYGDPAATISRDDHRMELAEGKP